MEWADFGDFRAKLEPKKARTFMDFLIVVHLSIVYLMMFIRNYLS